MVKKKKKKKKKENNNNLLPETVFAVIFLSWKSEKSDETHSEAVSQSIPYRKESQQEQQKTKKNGSDLNNRPVSE